MSHRQSKALRKVLRARGFDVREVKRAEERKNVRNIPGKALGADGKPKMVPFVYTGTVTMAASCGRRTYQVLKRVPNYGAAA